MNSRAIQLMSFFYLVVGLAALGIIFYFDLSKGIRFPHTFEQGVLQVLVGVGVGGIVIFCSRVAARLFSSVRTLEDGFRGVIGGLSAKDAFWAALASSVGEELFFRAALQPLVGLWIASGIFALLHWGSGKAFVAWPILALGAGLILGGLFELFEMIWAPIVAHFTINFVNLRYLSRPRGGIQPSIWEK